MADSAPVSGHPSPSPSEAGVSRRQFLGQGAAVAAGLSALAAAMSPLRHLSDDDLPSVEEFLQKHYKEMTPVDKERALGRIREPVKKRYGLDARVSDPPPLDGVEFVYGLKISRSIGCRKCVHACVAENNQSPVAGNPVHPRARDGKGRH